MAGSRRTSKRVSNATAETAETESMSESSLQTPRDITLEEENPEDDGTQDGSFRNNSNSGSDDSSVDEPPSTKRGRTNSKQGSKPKGGNKSRSRSLPSLPSRKKFNIHDKPEPFVPYQLPCRADPPTDALLEQAQFKKKATATDKLAIVSEKLDDAIEYAIGLHDEYSNQFDDMEDALNASLSHIQLQSQYIHGLSNEYDKLKAVQQDLQVKTAKLEASKQTRGNEYQLQKKLLTTLERDNKDLRDRLKQIEAKEKVNSNLEMLQAKQTIQLETQLKKHENATKLKEADAERKKQQKTQRIQQAMQGNRMAGSTGNWQSFMTVSYLCICSH